MPTAHSVAGAVLVDIDPSIFGGFVVGRFDIMIRGRAVSSEPIAEIGLFADGGMVACLQYGPPDTAARARLPDGTEAEQRAFQFSLARLETHAAGPCHCCIVVRTASGTVHEEPFELAVDPGSPVPVKLRSGPVHQAVDSAGVRTPAIIFVERALLDRDGNLQVFGWAVASTPITIVQVFIGERLVSSVGVTGEREDVARVYPAHPNSLVSGFGLNARLDGADCSPSAIRAQVICRDAASYEVAVPLERVSDRRLRPAGLPAPAAALTVDASTRPRSAFRLKTDFARLSEPMPGAPVPARLNDLPGPDRPAPDQPAVLPANDPRREISMFCDRAALSHDGCLLVVGWAVCAAGVARILVFFDDRPVGEADYGMERPDVRAIFPSAPSAAHAGFRFESDIGEAPEGEHTVHLVVYNRLGDHDVLACPAVTAPVAPPDAGSPADRPEFRFEMDRPSLVDGAMLVPVTGRLTIEGWVLARSGVTGVKVLLDDRHLGEAHYGLARQDVGMAFPDWVNALHSGYAFHCPSRSLRDGAHTVQIVVSSRNGQDHTESFLINVGRAEDKDDLANIRRRMTRVESRTMIDLLRSLAYRPHFRWLLRQTGKLDVARLRLTLNSLLGQVFDNWTVRVLCDRTDEAEPMREVIAGFSADPDFARRFEVICPADLALWDASLVEPADASATLCGMLCPGDELGCDALVEFALAHGLHREADFLYADEARISPASHEREPFCKPGFSPDLLLSTNYIGRPWVAVPAVLEATGVTPRALMRDGEYDLVLRCCEAAAAVRHVPKLLCQRGVNELDGAVAEKSALERAAARRGFAARVRPAAVSGTWRVQRAVSGLDKVSIIIPTCGAHGYIETCINTLRAKTAYRNFEIVVIDNIPEHLARWKSWIRQHADTVVDLPGAFNWSRFNNQATEAARGRYLLFLNDDIEIIQEEWLTALLEHAQQAGVGTVGPQLLYPDRKVQHAGMFLGRNGLGRHAFRFCAADEPGYFGLALTQRNVIAVTGACMLVRRETFDRLGRFDEAHEIINNDLDFCLRVNRSGLRTVFTPYATLIHHELASRARMKDVFDPSHFNAQWKTQYAAGDPYFNPRLSRHADDYQPDDEPVQTVFPGHPLFDVDDIKRILVVKLDHIGDFVTALPAIRRLKQLFPRACITVLAGAASQALVALEPSIDGFVAFDFFHARSQLGERELTRQDFEALGERLAPYRFDLAVDLRKHLSTRDVLRYAGARFLAGFDYMGQFPFLDIALEWDGDKALQRKRGHIVDDLLALVSAIGGACETDSAMISPTPPRPSVDALPEAVRRLFDRPVVVVHPGAGNRTKQWPQEHFSSLIDLLTERDGVSVILIGGPDEVEQADILLTTLLRQDRVVSVAGKTSLAELAVLLSACTLYIGNDSGPKHISAALSVPTIGIHSGVVDATEWAPLGRRAVALRRNMTCAPCYLQHTQDCPRNLACLTFLEPAIVHQTAEMLMARPVPHGAPARVPLDAAPPAAAPATTAARAASADPRRQAPTRPQPKRKTA